MRFKPMLKRMDSRSLGSMLVTESGKTYMRTLKSPHYGPPNRGPRLKPGMVICVEPMVNQGRRYVKTLSDDWTVVTVDGKWCAHFEHTIALTEAGYEILTTL